MIIKAIKLFENGFMTQALAMGGEGMEGIDPTVRYRSSLQNYLIDDWTCPRCKQAKDKFNQA